MPYVDRLQEDRAAGEREALIVAAANVSSSEELLSLLWTFPSIAQQTGIDAAALSNYAIRDAQAFMSVLAEEEIRPAEPPRYAMGAHHAPGAPWQPGSVVDLPSPAILEERASTRLAAVAEVDKRPGVAWPVRDQGQRGTCVAFAVAALREHLAHEITGTLPNLSEQFLFWATKSTTTDPRPTSDGTWIEFCRDALDSRGVPDEREWPYNGMPIPGNVTQADGANPSASATSDAGTRQHRAAVFHRGPAAGGNAAAVLRELRACRPVAISLPVFADPLRPAGHNWNSPIGVLYGKVLDPPPTSVVDGGHAVCVVGFIPDPGEPSGGHFVIRNSWGTGWGRALPRAGYGGFEPGYGQVSATYVDRFLWETCRL